MNSQITHWYEIIINPGTLGWVLKLFLNLTLPSFEGKVKIYLLLREDVMISLILKKEQICIPDKARIVPSFFILNQI